MKAYLYIFGYSSPRQTELNEKFGWDDEDSQAIFIRSDSEAQALEWGRKISEEFLRVLFKDRAVSWESMNFAHWIEPHPERAYPSERLSQIPVVDYGEYPNWERFVPHHY